MDKPAADEACEPATSMSAMDDNAVRYSAGYVSLKKYEKQGSAKTAEFVECLSNMAVDGGKYAQVNKSHKLIPSF